MSSDGAIIPCAICGHTTPIDGVCVGCKPTPQAVCIGCAYRGPRPTEAEPPATEPDTIAIPIGPDDAFGVREVAVDRSPPITWGSSSDHVSIGARAEPGVGVLHLQMTDATRDVVEAALKRAIDAIRGRVAS